MLSKTTELKIVAITDNKSAIDSINSTSLVSDKRLRVEMAAVREYQTKSQVNYQHVKGAHQTGDVLTKRGLPTSYCCLFFSKELFLNAKNEKKTKVKEN